MALIINHNLMAANAGRNLSSIYGKLSNSVQRLSSGLRINSAADDAAGLAIREMMRADIATTNQGLRNAADAISMIQTADGALGVIDEKLTRMKELAEQASTGTYTTIQREIINSEYQAMANEIDRIANATNFNGIKLLDGSVSNLHGGDGIKIHFGIGNRAAEDYYFINTGDARATSQTGLRVGGDAKNDIWAQGGASSKYNQAAGCCSTGFTSLDDKAGFTSGAAFSYGYNWDWQNSDETALMGGKYTAGLWQVSSSDSLQNLVDRVNLGTQSRVGIQFTSATGTAADLKFNTGGTTGLSAFAVCVGDEAYYWGTRAAASAAIDSNKIKRAAGTNGAAGKELTSAINAYSSSNFWAMWNSAVNTCYVFTKEGGDNNNLTACEVYRPGQSATTNKSSLNCVNFENVATGQMDDSGANFSMGGEQWGHLAPVLSRENHGSQVWNLTLSGRDVGNQRDLWVANMGSASSYHDLRTDPTIAKTKNTAYQVIGKNIQNINGLNRDSFTEVQNASDGLWRGAEVRTQSSAQEALDAITSAIVQKDTIRANLGAIQNRLENTMTNLSVQSENLQAAESRISDVDVASEMTEFTKNNIMAQAATSMLAQANSLAGLALQLL